MSQGSDSRLLSTSLPDSNEEGEASRSPEYTVLRQQLSCVRKLIANAGGVSTSDRGPAKYDFEVLSEQQVYRRYLTLYNRRIKFPGHQGRPAAVHEYDVVGHPQSSFHFTVVFPFHTNRSAPGGGEVSSDT